MPVQVPVSHLIQLPVNVHPKSQHMITQVLGFLPLKHSDGISSSWLRPDATLTVASIWHVNQWIEDQSPSSCLLNRWMERARLMLFLLSGLNESSAILWVFLPWDHCIKKKKALVHCTLLGFSSTCRRIVPQNKNPLTIFDGSFLLRSLDCFQNYLLWGWYCGTAS